MAGIEHREQAGSMNPKDQVLHALSAMSEIIELGPELEDRERKQVSHMGASVHVYYSKEREHESKAIRALPNLGDGHSPISPTDRALLREAENLLRIHARGVELISLRHRIRDRLANETHNTESSP